MAVKKYGPNGELDPLMRTWKCHGGFAMAAEFEKTLDLNWTEEDILKIVNEEAVSSPFISLEELREEEDFSE